MKKKSQKKEIIWNVVNSLLAGGLVMMGGLTTGGISRETLLLSLLVGLTAAFTQFKTYWVKEQSEYSTKLFTFIKI